MLKELKVIPWYEYQKTLLFLTYCNIAKSLS